MSIYESDVEEEMLGWFEDLGYEVVAGPELAPDGATPERKNYKQVLLEGRLRDALHRLNPDLPAAAIDDAVDVMRGMGTPGLMGANREFQRRLTTGMQVFWQRDGETKSDRVRLVDFTDPDKNDWLVVNQFTVIGATISGSRERRPDAVVFLNGMPVAVFELKNPATENADVWAAYRQLQTYKEEIPELFRTNGLLVASDGVYARMGSLSADEERYMAWRTFDGKEKDPLGQFGELETLVRGVFEKEHLLDYLRHFIIFEDDGGLSKKIAAYHQFHAVRAVVAQVLEASAPGGSGKGGVVWHTQGAGKSLEMTCLAGKLMTHPQMKNPTIVVVTDRNDLDGQLHGTFDMAAEVLGETPVQVDSRTALREHLNDRPSGGIIFTTIQKFVPGEDEDAYPTLTERDNVVVLCDEAHRSQYGMKARIKVHKDETTSVEYGYAKYLRDALPNATFVAFTGTPIASKDKDTRAVFGDYVDIYDIEQAVKDKATVPIYYESRLVKLELLASIEDTLDDEIDALTEDEEESARARTKSRWAALEKLVATTPRLETVAADMVQHFETRNDAMQGKAMVVCMSREVCALLYGEIVKLRREWHDADPEKGAIKVVMTGSASDREALRPHIYSAKVKKRLEKRFKDAADPLKIVIVRDMWLTGFDVPCLTTMYVDKPMKDHNLMQAIARVNRVFKDKPGGLVVDYIGIANELKQALREYTQSKGQGRPTIPAQEMLAKLQEEMEVAWGLLHGVDYSDFRVNALKPMRRAADHILGLEDGKRRFADCVLRMTQAFALCCTLPDAAKHREDIAFFQAVRTILTKSDPTKALSDDAREHALRQIISRAVVSAEVMDIFGAAGLARPDVGILSDEFLEDVRKLKERNLAVEVLERLLKGQIRSRFASNVVQSRKFSELLQDSLTRYRNRAIETSQVIEELIAMAKQFQAAAERGEHFGLTADEMAFYDALAANEASVRELGDVTLRKIAQELTAKLKASNSVDWYVRESVRAKLRLMVKTILKKWKYPPDGQDVATETVLDQAKELSAAWAVS
ncbi:MAG TPA: type I restriction endonuclease subunit R [Edaphobacter sp.]|nr:type I restriction endonuclease subunit R [Edaphobacter sp.]